MVHSFMLSRIKILKSFDRGNRPPICGGLREISAHMESRRLSSPALLCTIFHEQRQSGFTYFGARVHRGTKCKSLNRQYTGLVGAFSRPSDA